MADWLYILVSVSVAAFVGGVTNHFAIKMLFHPRNPVYIGKFHVPFTPGLIPKRREDIAESLGTVVADYLVTTEGIQELVTRPAFKKQAEQYLENLLVRLGESEMTLKEAALMVWEPQRWEEVKLRLADTGRSVADRGLSLLWNDLGYGDRSLKDLVPGWNEENRMRWSGVAAEAVLRAVEEELLSAEGQRMLTKMVGDMADKAGGFLGTMAAIFMDEDKLVRKLTPTLVRALQSEEAKRKITNAIQGRMEVFGEKPVTELIGLVTGVPAPEWLSDKMNKLPLEQWIGAAERLRVSSLVDPWKARATGALPAISERIISIVSKGIPMVMKAIQLPKLVQEQVQKFPVERLEEVILSVSGKEFRAITWLGVLLGGIIGLFQSLLMLWMG
ncbi:uncharacterized membrane protein YheB (UPF0754 family) [Fontibacillus phaseoli]|uniref:Uncharacterized membrane protein YheB (UPF0754 family) n=1 Tax=Fontibacillus phaseoli TaxID=1416533 RepID=A0A369B716_9BACL|nr:DUF445 family protein [Fontibacillus phaseoli]RCX17309.1 uncharacterized membrane protein YheB (UPF0754 family) [Fontibacillus phaseoli]